MAVLDDIQSDLQSPEAGTHQLSKRIALSDSATKHLPLEILAKIFMHCLDRSVSTGHAEIRIPGDPLPPAPWMLSQVCSRWRRIVLTEPQLWNSVIFDGDENHIPMLEKALERCGRSSIGLNFSAYHIHHTNIIGDIILPRSSQFRELSLYLETDVFDEFLRLPPGLFDALECVDLSCKYSIRTPSEETRVFRGAPRLHRITIRIPQEELSRFRSFPLPLGLPWAQLTHFNFGAIGMPLTIVHKLMNLGSNLHECHLCLYDDSDIIDPLDAREHSTGTILLPRLRELELDVKEQYATVDLYCRYLRPLRLPALQKFKFVLPESAEQPTSVFAAMIADLSSPSLCSELSFYMETQFGFFPAEIVAPLTFVTCIKFPFCPLPRSVMELIFQGKIFPKLVSLCVHIDTADMEAFITMLRMQWSTKSQSQLPHTVTRIRSARICINNASTAVLSHFTQEIDQLRDQFDLDIRLMQTLYDFHCQC